MVTQIIIGPRHKFQKTFKIENFVYYCKASTFKKPYLEACEREGITFIPLPVETLGGWQKKAVEQLRKLAKAQAGSTGEEEEESIRHLFQRLGVLLVKGNAALSSSHLVNKKKNDISS